jgi:O-antigen ligase
LAVVVMMLLFVLPQLSTRRRVAAVALTCIAAIVVYQVPGVPDLLSERTGSAVTTGGAGRTDIWSVAATIYQSAPVLGVGFANFPVAYTGDVVRASGIGFVAGTGRGPHDVLIGTLVELGPLGLALFLLFLIPLAFRRGWGPDGATVQAALVSLLTLALFLDIVTNRKQVWLVVGLAAGLRFLDQRRAAASGVVGDQAALPATTDSGAIRLTEPGTPGRSW